MSSMRWTHSRATSIFAERSRPPEQVGVLKLLKLAVETEKFMKALEAEGRDKYTIGEYHEKVYAPVMNL